MQSSTNRQTRKVFTLTAWRTFCPITIPITAGTIAISDSVTISVVEGIAAPKHAGKREGRDREMQAERLHEFVFLEPDRLHVGQGPE